MYLIVLAVVVALCKFGGGQALTEVEMKEEALEQAGQVKKDLKLSLEKMFKSNHIDQFGYEEMEEELMKQCIKTYWSTITVRSGEVFGIQDHRITAFHWNESTPMDSLKFTIDIDFPLLRFEFKDLYYKISPLKYKQMSGNNPLNFKSCKFKITVKKQVSDGINDLWFYDIHGDFMNMPEFENIGNLGNITSEVFRQFESNFTAEEKKCLIEYLLSNVKYHIENYGKELFLSCANKLVQSGHLRTDKIQAYNKLKQSALKDIGKLEGILIKPLADLFPKEAVPLGQLTLQEEQQTFANWEDKDWQMSVAEGEILKLNSVQYDNIYCNFDSMNKLLLCDVEIHFTKLIFKFTHLTHKIDSPDMKSLLGSQTVTYSDVYFSIHVTAEETNGFKLIDMNCQYNSYRHTEQSSSSLLTLEKLYLHAFLMSNLKYHIESNSNLYLTKGNQLIKPKQANGIESLAVAYVYNLPKERYEELQSILQKTELWMRKDLFKSQLKMASDNIITNWPDQTWNMSMEGGYITSILHIENDELCSCRYNRLTNKIRCTQKFYFPELSFQFTLLQYTIDNRQVVRMPNHQVIHYEDIHFSLITMLKRIEQTKFIFESMYVSYNHADTMVLISETAKFPNVVNFWINQFLMANMKYEIEDTKNREAFLKESTNLINV